MGFRQAVVFMGSLFLFFALNIVTFAVFGGDSPRREEILDVSGLTGGVPTNSGYQMSRELVFARSSPGVVVWGTLGDVGHFRFGTSPIMTRTRVPLSHSSLLSRLDSLRRFRLCNSALRDNDHRSERVNFALRIVRNSVDLDSLTARAEPSLPIEQ